MYKSNRQRRYFHAAEAKGEMPHKVVAEFDKASKGMHLPEKAKHKMAKGGMLEFHEALKQQKDQEYRRKMWLGGDLPLEHEGETNDPKEREEELDREEEMMDEEKGKGYADGGEVDPIENFKKQQKALVQEYEKSPHAEPENHDPAPKPAHTPETDTEKFVKNFKQSLGDNEDHFAHGGYVKAGTEMPHQIAHAHERDKLISAMKRLDEKHPAMEDKKHSEVLEHLEPKAPEHEKEEHMSQGGKLDADARTHIAEHNFAIPSERKYPIEDASHARNALARVSQFGSPEEKAKVRASVHRKYPDMGKAEGGLAKDNEQSKKKKFAEALKRRR